jgi:hypothetical protein
MIRPTDSNGHREGSWLDELMTAEQLAELLRVRKSTVEDYAPRGLLPSVSSAVTGASSGRTSSTRSTS